MISTLSILTLLVLIAIAMLSLATTSTQTRVSVAHLESAKANARLALVNAIGALQEALGPDTRVSANSSIIDDGSVSLRSKHILGVWDSSATMLPSLSVSNETSNSKLTASYGEHRVTNFRRWLVPGASSVDSSSGDLATRRKAMDYHVIHPSGHSEIKLVGKGTVGQDASEDLHVMAPLINIDKNGGYSWWISGENQKARVAINSTRWDHVSNAESHSSNLVNHSSAPSFNLSAFSELVNYDESGAKKHVSFESALLDSGDRINAKKLYHSISPYSVGLFTNTAWGGVKKDLNLASEYEYQGSLLGMNTRIRMGRDEDYSSTSPYSKLLNYCRTYKKPKDGGMVNWDYLNGEYFPTLCIAEPIENSDMGVETLKSNPYSRDRLPVMSKWYFILSHYVVKDGVWPERDHDGDGINEPEETRYALNVCYDIVQEYWNPYNLPYRTPLNKSGESAFRVFQSVWSMPYALSYYNNDKLVDETNWVVPAGWNSAGTYEGVPVFALFRANTGRGNPATHHTHTDLGADLLQAGEHRIYSSAGNTVDEVGSQKHMELLAGWSIEGGITIDKFPQASGSSRKLYFREDDIVAPALHVYHQEYIDRLASYKGKNPNLNTRLNYNAYNGDPMRTTSWILNVAGRDPKDFSASGGFPFGLTNNPLPTDEKWRKGIYADSLPLSDGNKVSVSSIVGFNRKRPFAMFGYDVGTEKNDRASLFAGNTKDFPELESNKWKNKAYIWGMPYTRYVTFDHSKAALSHSSRNFFVQRLESWADSGLPEIDAYNRGYSGSSVFSHNGQTNVVALNIPFQPLTSLAQLQHSRVGEMSSDASFGRMNAINDNARKGHPSVLNAIGNSFATPFMSPEHFRNDLSKLPSPAYNPQRPGIDLKHSKSWYQDKSYLLNEVLWDSWFFSSIAEYDNPWVADSLRGSKEDLLRGIVEGKRVIPNSRFVFTSLDSSGNLFDVLNDSDGYKKVAAHMKCLGAFNVNCTDETVWRSFLTSLDGKTLIMMKSDFTGFDTEEDYTIEGKESSYYVGRSSLPTIDPARSTDYAANAPEFIKRRWHGNRQLSGEEITQLSKEIVKQVKLRGPFLSLGDFVNRQLRESDPEHKRHLKGALQAAIDQTSINKSFDDTSEVINKADVADYGYPFPEAVTGKASEGAPGYITQADLLTPLAPVIRVRDDSFVIRAYGESRDGTGKVVSRAFCEAVVTREYQFIDATSDSADKEVFILDDKPESLNSTLNTSFGRRMKVISFRWLVPSEV